MWAPCTTVVVLVAVVGVTGIRGADYPAQLLRAELWRRAGPAIWNNLWYGGHATPTYSVLTPPVAALLGPFWLTAIASVGATYWFSRLTTASVVPPPRTALANHAFAVAVTIDVVVGRTAFAFGLALALGTAWAWHRHRTALALLAAGSSTLASPVAGMFLVLAATAVAVDRLRAGRRCPPHDRAVAARAAGIALAALAPLGAAVALFHEPARFPFEAGGMAASIVALAAAGVAVRDPAVRAGAMLAVGAAVVVFLVPNPLGGSFARLTQIVAVPVALTAADRLRRASLMALLVLGTTWSVLPGVGAIRDWIGDRSVDAGFHAPLVAEVRARNRDGGPVGRLEIPFTRNHWESFHVASEVPFARGWERQIDLVRNAELYDPGLTVAAYRRWLLDHGVRWLAVPDVPLDAGGRVEAALVSREGTELDIPWLRRVWWNADWDLYEVVAPRPIVDPPADLLVQLPDRVVIDTERPATVTVRYVYRPYWTISSGACIERGSDGWIVAHLPASGRYTLRTDVSAIWRRTAPCGGATRGL